MIRRLLALALVLTSIACSDGITTPDGMPSSEGVITGMERETQIPGILWNMRVDAPFDDPCAGWLFLIGPDTQIWTRGPDGKPSEVEIEALVVGTRVRVWASSAIRDQCPALADASSVEFLP